MFYNVRDNISVKPVVTEKSDFVWCLPFITGTQGTGWGYFKSRNI